MDNEDKRSTKNSVFDIKQERMFQYSTKALDKAHSLCLRVLTLPIVLLRNTTKQKTQTFLEHWRGWAQNVPYSTTFLLEHTVRSSLENSAF